MTILNYVQFITKQNKNCMSGFEQRVKQIQFHQICSTYSYLSSPLQHNNKINKVLGVHSVWTLPVYSFNGPFEPGIMLSIEIQRWISLGFQVHISQP